LILLHSTDDHEFEPGQGQHCLVGLPESFLMLITASYQKLQDLVADKSYTSCFTAYVCGK